MKIAVASNDGTSISHHFGQSKCFVVFDIADGKIAGRQVRDNTYTAFAKGNCAGGEAHQHRDAPHSHADIVEALRDCQIVLCYGMGWRAAEELAQSGIQPLVFSGVMSPDEAVGAYLAGTLNASKAFCRCHE